MEFFTKSSFSYLSSRVSFMTSILPVFFLHTFSVISSPGILFLITSRRVIPFQSGMPATSVIISPTSNQLFRTGELVITSPEVIVKLRFLIIFGVSGFVWMPIKARLIVPFFSTEFIIYLISPSERGIANPSPVALLAMTVLIPITFPSRFTRGHHEFPGLMAASVWMSPVRSSVSVVLISPASIVRPRAEITPKVTVFLNSARAFPMAIRKSPTSRELALSMKLTGSRHSSFFLSPS